MKISYTGHRSPKLGGYKTPNPIYNYVRGEVVKILTELKPECAASGMALGADTIGAEVCIELGIPFIAAVPFLGQEKIWPEEAQNHYRNLLDKAKEIIVVSEGGYSASKMQIRNQWLINYLNAPEDKLIAIFDGTPGGTANCVQYALEQKKSIIRIDPTNYGKIK